MFKFGICSQCKQCFASFMETSSLQQHALAHKSYKPFKCHICICFFAQKVALQCHMKRHERQKPFRRYQNSSSIKKSGVMQPKRTNHLTKSLREDKTVQIFCCKKCRSSFPEESLLRKHARWNSCSSRNVFVMQIISLVFLI